VATLCITVCKRSAAYGKAATRKTKPRSGDIMGFNIYDDALIISPHAGLRVHVYTPDRKLRSFLACIRLCII